MKRFSTLLTAAAVFFTVQVNAQSNYFEDFEDGFTSPGQQCIDTTDILYASSANPNTNGFIIKPGSGSAFAEPPVSGATVRVFSTPYLSMPAATQISFDYQLTSKLSNGASRFINVGTIDSLGNFSSLDSFGLDPNKTGVLTYTRNLNLAGTSVRRLSIRIGGGGGDGNSRIAFDNISVNAPAYNNGSCNNPPVAVADTYYAFLLTEAISGNVITDMAGLDSDPDGNNLTATLLTNLAPSVGSLTFGADGAFTFTPAATFGGGLVQFSYRITDDGYPRLSATTTVSLEYPVLAPMPVKLMSFAGSIASNKAQLRWSVADNETGDQFQVLRSADGNNFTEVGTVFISHKAGAESYTFADSRDLDAVTYYKLKIINKDRSVSYSNVIALKSATAKTASGITILKNPVESVLTFTYSATTAAQGQVAIYNTLGVKVFSSRLTSQKGSNSVSLTLEGHLAAGTYILEVVNGTDRAVTRMIKR